MKVKSSRGERIYYCLCYFIVALLTLFVLYPVVYVISASFSSPNALQSGSVWLLPVDFTLDGYKAVFNYQKIWIGYRNTIFYTVVGTFINIVVTMMCAYPMARRNLRGRKYIMFFFTFTMIFSGGMIPKYIVIKSLGLLNTRTVLLVHCAFSVYNMIVARTFIQTNIADELWDSARIDGCNDTVFFYKMVLPLSKAVIAVLVLWYAVGHWNSYFDAFLYLSDYNLYPLQVFLKEVLVQNSMSAELIDSTIVDQSQNLRLLLKYAMIVVSTAPLFCVYPFIQKYFQEGVMVGSVKG